jgi:hypothetical protein
MTCFIGENPPERQKEICCNHNLFTGDCPFTAAMFSQGQKKGTIGLGKVYREGVPDLKGERQ